MLEVSIWVLTVTLMSIGVLGVIVPLLPGTTLILIAALVHKLVLPDDFSWWTFAVIGIFWAISIAAEIGGVILGTKWFGGTKWGMAGAGGGALVGMFFSLPALLLGTFLGAVLAEKLGAKQPDGASFKAGVGAATGFVLSTVARLGCALAMVGIFLVAALSGKF